MRYIVERVTETMTEFEEKQLIHRALDGDDLAFNELIEAYYLTVERFARQIGVSENDLPDVTQEVFLRVYRFLNKYSRGKFSTWLYSITLNVARDYFKKAKREKRKVHKTIQAGVDVAYENSLDLSADLKILHEAIQQLDELYRIPIVLFYFHDKSILEISSILKMKESTVKTRLRRGRSYLKTEMIKGGY